MPHFYPPSPGEQRWRAAGYFFVACVGFWIIFGPNPADSETRSYIIGVIRVVWAVMMTTALPTAVAALTGRYRLEFMLLPVFGSALIVAVFNTIIRIFQGDLDLVPRTLMALVVLCFLVVRGLQLHRVVKAEPWITTG